MKILLTGGAGFVGSHLTEYILNKKNFLDLYIIDNLSTGSFEKIKEFKKKINFFKSDLKNINKINLNKKFDWVIHCAALAPLPENQSVHFNSLISNVAICGSLIDWCVKNGNKNIIFLSTAAVYENNKKIPFSEKDIVNPNLMYSSSKYLAEQYFESAAKSYNMKIVVLRLANVYGKNQDYFRKQPPLIGYLIKSILMKKKCNLFAKGNYPRDYIYIDDLSNLIYKIIRNKFISKKFFLFKIFNVGSGCVYSVKDFIYVIEKILNKRIKIVWKNKKNYWSKYKLIYNSKLKFNTNLIKKEVEKKVLLNLNETKKFFSWHAKVDIERGMLECINYATKYLKIK